MVRCRAGCGFVIIILLRCLYGKTLYARRCRKFSGYGGNRLSAGWISGRLSRGKEVAMIKTAKRLFSFMLMLLYDADTAL